MNKIDLLDHGYVRLVDHMGSDLSVVRSARVSYNAAWRAGDDEGSDKKLINYLWKNHHDSPFESVEFQFEVYAPIFVFRQWHRHRTWSYNELSGRYRELEEVFYVPEPENIGQQATNNKQGRQESDVDRNDDINELIEHCCSAFAIYRRLLAKGWPRELARMVLPLNTYSHMFAKTNMRNLFHFMSLRNDPHAQHEVRVYGEAMLELVRPIVPNSVEAWEKFPRKIQNA